MNAILVGGEPYLVDKKRKEFRAGIEFPELDYASFSCMGKEVVEFLQVPPMGTKRMAYLPCNDIREVIEHPLFIKGVCAAGCSLLVRYMSADMRSRSVRELPAGSLIHYDKAAGKKELCRLIPAYLKKLGASFSDENTYQEFLDRINYDESPEVSIYTVMDYIKTLAVLGDGLITLGSVETTVDFSKGKVFRIADLLRKKDRKGLAVQAELLQGQEIATLSALLREYRIAYKAKRYSLKEINCSRVILSYMDSATLLLGMEVLTKAIRDLKTGAVPAKYVLVSVFFKLIENGKEGMR